MRHNLLSVIVVIAISLTTITCFGVPADTKNNMVHNCFTPPKGTPMRKDILDTLRREVKHTSGIDAIFIVKYLKVQDGWAWIHALPLSADGTNRYEDVQALLKLQNGKWKIMELPCTEVENPECLGDPKYFLKLKKRFPNLPIKILPKE
ncbi:MAG: hypothetical protein PHE73_00890 [Sulfurovaceae bacterium]|nr:hypothetical protein [Sulfurovaceae bacterium]